MIGDVFEMFVQLSGQNRQMRVGFAYKQVGGPDNNTLASDCNDAWLTDVLPTFADLLSTEITLQCLYCRRVAPAPGVPDTLNFISEAGTRAGDPIPNDSPYVIRQITDALSSKANGRQFISGVSQTDTLAGVLTAAYIAGPLAAYLTQALLDISPPSDLTIDFQPSVICRIVDGLPLDPPVANRIIAVSNDTFIKSQRRRRTRNTEVGT